MAGLSSALEEICRAADEEAPRPGTGKADAPSSDADTSAAVKQNDAPPENAGNSNMDELYEEYSRWKKEQERKKLLEERAQRRLKQPELPSLVEEPLIQEVDPNSNQSDKIYQSGLAGIVFVDDEGDAANGFLIEEIGSGALLEVPVALLHKVESEAPQPAQAKAKDADEPMDAIPVRAEEPAEVNADVPAREVEELKIKSDAPAQQVELPAKEVEQLEVNSDAPAQQVEESDPDSLRRRLLEDRARRRAAAKARSTEPEAQEHINNQAESEAKEAPAEPADAQLEEPSKSADQKTGGAEAMRQKLLEDRARRKAADRARRQEEEAGNHPEMVAEGHQVASAVASKGEQIISERSAEQVLRFLCDSSCPFAQQVWIFLEEKGIEYQYVPTQQVSREFHHEFAAASPLGLVPILEYTRQPGHVDLVRDSMACMEYVEEVFDGPPLLPAGNPALRAHVRAWCSFANLHLVPLCSQYMSAQTPSYQAQDQVAYRLLDRLEAIGKAMSPLHTEDTTTGIGAYFLGESFCMLDVTIFPWWLRLTGAATTSRKLQIPAGGAFDRLRAWGDACGKRSSVANTLLAADQV